MTARIVVERRSWWFPQMSLEICFWRGDVACLDSCVEWSGSEVVSVWLGVSEGKG